VAHSVFYQAIHMRHIVSTVIELNVRLMMMMMTLVDQLNINTAV